jgi:DUF1680 family protein
VSVETDYPWDGVVRVRLERAPAQEWTLSLRVPAWAGGATLSVNGESPRSVETGSYAAISRIWEAGDVVELVLPMTVRLTEADERIDSVRGCVAIERGPLVYAVEQVDQADGVVVEDLRLDPANPARAEHRSSLLGGVTIVSARGRASTRRAAAWPYHAAGASGYAAATDTEVIAVPYFAWANRGAGPMRVWLPRS